MKRLTLLTLCCLVAAQAQQVGQNTDRPSAASGGLTFSSSTQLVVDAVVVKDKNGNPVEGLTAKDFTLTEDGVPQAIRVFEYQKLASDAATLPKITGLSPALAKLPRTHIGPSSATDPRYQNKRLLALYFDLTAMPLPDQVRAFAAAQKFVREQMTSSDLLAIMSFAGGAVRVLHDFSGDRESLLTVLQTLIVGEDQNAPDTGDPDAAFGQNDSEFNIFFTDRQLAALQTAASMMSQIPEKKSMIYFASGLRLNGLNNQAQLHATINAAIRAGVALWPVDARGLIAQAPLGDASAPSPGGVAAYSGVTAMTTTSNLQRSQDTLWTLGADTGGKALIDFNDLTRGITEAQKANSSYYLIGYYTTNANPDGKFRRVKITLNSELAANAKLEYRQGYYAAKQFGKFSVAEKERQLEDALMLGDPLTEITIALEVDYFQLNRAEYFVPVTVKIPGSELALARRRGADRTMIDFVGEIKDSFGSTVSNVRDKIDIKLNESTAAELAKRPLQYDTGFTLLPGKYKLKFLARDAVTGRIGTYEAAFTIPNLNKEAKRVPISSVVLSSQKIELSNALYNAKDKLQAAAVSPLVQQGQKLLPSVTRVFSRTKPMYVYLEAYQPPATPEPLLGFVTLYRGEEKLLESAPTQVTNGGGTSVKALPFDFALALEKLPPGEYRCQVTILDPHAHKAAFWQAPVMLIP